MKVRCIKNKYESGFGPFKTIKKVNLTLNKTYEILAVPIVQSGFAGTRIGNKDIRFLVFNDVGEWQCYRKSMFAPSDGE